MTSSSVIWHKGQWMPWEQATVHVFTHGLLYGSVVFEGIRAYAGPMGPRTFRLQDHITRFYESARICALPLPCSRAELVEVCREAVRRNGLTSAYIRPVAYRGAGSLKVYAPELPVEVTVAAIAWGGATDPAAAEKGIDVGVSSWRRPAGDTTPAFAKTGAHYMSMQLITGEARRQGYTQGIGLDVHGHISEAPVQNVFIVRRGRLYTPPVSASILEGITRDTVMTLARSMGIEVREEAMPRELVYVADEMFLTGTSTEISAVRAVDGVVIGEGKRGPITASLQRAFDELTSGAVEDRWHWLEPI